MRLLVTRPEHDAADLARALKAKGHSVRLEPLLQIVPVPDATVPDGPFQALLVTSANGVRALALLPAVSRLSKLPVLAVGVASGDAAQAAGFATVQSAAGDLDDLARLVGKTCDPSGGPLLYVTGSVVSGDLKGVLERLGFRVDRAVLYDAVECHALSAITINELRNQELDGVLLYSPRSARIWARCVTAAKLGDATRALTHYCLSPSVARALEQEYGHRPPDIRTADTPSQEHLMALLSA